MILGMAHIYIYEPNMIAQSLVNSSTKILGLILPSTEDDMFENPFYRKNVDRCLDTNR